MDVYGCGAWQSLEQMLLVHISYKYCTFCTIICPRRIVRLLIQVFTGILAVSLVALGAWYGVEDQPERRIIAVWSIDKYDTYDILFQTIGSQVLSKQAATEFRITISNA